ncbi:MAG TPA: outer membrane lipoprotein carrier protein LolA [Pseudomonadales bacterium]|nr:outer membrane lipoprotein carrier protein LolA [Pseudomonadales bacterium]
MYSRIRFLSGAALLATSCAVIAGGDGVLREQVLTALAKQPQKHFHFVQEKKLAVLDKPLVTEGELQIAGEQDVIWDIRKPYAIRYDIHGGKIRETDDSGEHVTDANSNPLAAALQEAMGAALSGHWQNREDLASVAASGTLASWQLHITPRNADLQKLVQTIDVDGDNGVIHQVLIHESNGDTTVIHLQAMP